MRSARQRQEKRALQRGQIIFEFVLLLFISVTIATLITKRIVSRDPENPGFLTGAWARMASAVGSDIVE